MSSPADVSRARLWVFILACAASWLLYLHRYSWSVVRPDFHAEHPHLSDVDMGWLDSTFSIVYAAGQIPGGILGDFLGPRLALTGYVLVWSVALAGLAWVSGFLPAILCRSFLGLGQAGVYPVLSKVTRDWFPLEVRTSMQGTVTALGRLGAASAYVIVGSWLISELGLNWRDAILLVSSLGLVLAAGLWFLVPNRPPESVATAASAAGSTAWKLDLATCVTVGLMLLYSFASTFQDQFYVNLVPTFLKDARGMSGSSQGYFATLPLVGGAFGGIVGGMLNDALIRRTGNRRWIRVGVAFTGKSAAAALVLLSISISDGRLTMAVLMLARFFGDWGLATLWGAITDVGGRASAPLFGLINTFGMLGGVGAGVSMGYLKQHYGFDGVLYGVAIMSFVAALCWLGIDCTRKVVSD